MYFFQYQLWHFCANLFSRILSSLREFARKIIRITVSIHKKTRTRCSSFRIWFFSPFPPVDSVSSNLACSSLTCFANRARDLSEFKTDSWALVNSDWRRATSFPDTIWNHVRSHPLAQGVIYHVYFRMWLDSPFLIRILQREDSVCIRYLKRNN